MELVPVDADCRATPVEETEVIAYVETDHILELESDTASGEDIDTVLIAIIGNISVIKVDSRPA